MVFGVTLGIKGNDAQIDIPLMFEIIIIKINNNKIHLIQIEFGFFLSLDL